MKQTTGGRISLHVPNLLAICVNQKTDGEIAGELYHCYTTEPWTFTNLMQMLEAIEELYNRISFPQAAQRTRTLVEMHSEKKAPLEKVQTPEQVAEHRGRLGTFLLCVKHRQNASWQGEMQWVEEQEKITFTSELEFIKQIHNRLTDK